MEPNLSRKIRNISFLLLILVAFIHGYNENLRLAGWGAHNPSPWLIFIERFVSDGFCRLAVPLFFSISGYLASESIGRKFSIRACFYLLKKRVGSLLIPYLLVSATGIGLVILLQLFPVSQNFFNNYRLATTPLSGWLRIWLLNPVPFQLWFIRFLMNYFLFFPFLFLAVRYLKELFLVILFVFWAWPFLYSQIGFWKIAFSMCTMVFCFISQTDWLPYIPTQKNELEGLFFFTLGIYVSLKRIPLILPVGKLFSCFFILIWLLWVAYRTQLFFEFPSRHNEIHYHLIGFTMAGLVLLWYAYDAFSFQIESWKWLNRFAPYTFGIFLFHEPLLTIFKKGIIYLLGVGDFTLLFSFLISPVLAFLFALWFSVFLAGTAPHIYNLFTGNRNPVPKK